MTPVNQTPPGFNQRIAYFPHQGPGGSSANGKRRLLR